MEETLDDLFLMHVLHEQAAEHIWDDTLLHVSDLCSCPRQVALRLTSAAMRDFTHEEARKKAYRFYLANFLHEQQFIAWAEAGILIEKECSIRGYLPKGWTGRFDAIVNYNGGPRIVDVKTVEYLQKTGTYPKPSHAAQVACYQKFIGDDWGLTHDALLFYIQRNLMHYQAQECAVSLNDHNALFVEQEMARLEAVRNALPDLPPILARTLKFTGRKVKGQYKEISLVTNHSCTTDWCDYSMGPSCTPDVGSDLIAFREDGDDFTLTDYGAENYAEAVVDFLNGELMDEYEGD
jgi:hypothetical protein